MRRIRFRRRFTARVVQLLVVALVATGAMFAFGVGSAFAAGTVFCPPFGTDTAADVQTAANGGGTVTIFGVCSGNISLTANVTLKGGTPGATSGLDGTGFDGPVISQLAGAELVNVQNLLVTGGGHNSGDGGGIWNDNRDCVAVTNVVSSRIINNTIDVEDAWGAGLNAEFCTTMNVTNSLVSGNKTTAPEGDGAGIASDDAAAVNVTGSTITRNSADGVGGGIWGRDTVLNVTASKIGRAHV